MPDRGWSETLKGGLDRVEVHFVAPTPDGKREGATLARTMVRQRRSGTHEKQTLLKCR